jgi:hypothetical protein
LWTDTNYSSTERLTGERVDTWINEGLSTAAEYVYAGDPAGRVRYYNDDPLGTIQIGNNFFYWGGIWDSDILADYTTAYLFFQWLRMHSSNGIGIYKVLSVI